MKLEQKTITTIIADEGKLLKRKSDGWIVGNQYTLGYNYFESGIGLSSPKLEKPEDFEEIDKPGEYEEPVIIDNVTRLKNASKMIEDIKSDMQNLELTSEEALELSDWFPEIDNSLIGTQIKTGDFYRYDGKLWEAIKDFQYQLGWEPGINTASIWKVVDKEHSGTQEDPIPYFPPMEIFEGKYYTEKGILYKCTRNSGIPLSHELSALVGTYVEEVK